MIYQIHTYIHTIRVRKLMKIAVSLSVCAIVLSDASTVFTHGVGHIFLLINIFAI